MGPPIYEAGTVIPVSFDISLGSGESRPGQRFSTVISDYPGIPNGSRVEGVVRDSAPAGGRQSGALELAFDTIVTPTGHRYHIDGQAVPMNDPNISRGSNGRLVASKGVASKRYLFANAGGSAKLVNVNSRAAISDPRTQKEIGQRAPAGGPARNVQLSPGMKFGIRLNAAVKLK
jgi:hypothetical protein